METVANLRQEAVAPEISDRSSCIFTSDACQHAASLPDWSQEYLQLSPGRFSGEIVEASTGPIQVFRETLNQCVDEKAHPRPDTYTIGVPIEVEPGGFWQGRELVPDSLMTLNPNEELHFRTPRQSSILVTVVDRAAFERHALASVGIDVQPLIARSRAEQVRPDLAQQYRATLNNVLACSITTPEVLEYPASSRAMTEAVMNAALLALRARPSTSEQLRYGHHVQRAIVERARNHILADPENPPTVSALSAHLKMSRRGLHHAFINVLGINAATFLRYVRLHGVRKELLRAGNDQSVSAVAYKWGFWHMGMFSSYYKTLFGETPSATLRHPPGIISTQQVRLH